MILSIRFEIIVAGYSAGHWSPFEMMKAYGFSVNFVDIDRLRCKGNMAVMAAGCTDAGTDHLAIILKKTSFDFGIDIRFFILCFDPAFNHTDFFYFPL